MPLVILYFVLFPLGQLLRIENTLFDIPFAVQLIDVVPVVSAVYVLLSKQKVHPLRKHFIYFWAVCLLSLLLAATRYPLSEVLRGSLYLIRFVSYYFLFEMIWNLRNRWIATKNSEFPPIITSWLLGVLSATALFGWLQYFLIPDLRWLKMFNWDDHLYRLAGTILDPGFMGILMVFGVLITSTLLLNVQGETSTSSESINSKLTPKKGVTLSIHRCVYGGLSLFFIATLLFTYARASYIALIVGIGVIIFDRIKRRNTKNVNWIPAFAGMTMLAVLVLGAFIFLLPRTAGEGVKLERLNSIYEKGKNYQETLAIFRDYPVFGVGFNTLCSERALRYGGKTFESHACSGSDSSILFILVTTGVVGGIVFFNIIVQLIKHISKNVYSQMLMACGPALLVHSLFLNSLFYPWVMGIFVVLLGLSVSERKMQ